MIKAVQNNNLINRNYCIILSIRSIFPLFYFYRNDQLITRPISKEKPEKEHSFEPEELDQKLLQV